MLEALNTGKYTPTLRSSMEVCFVMDEKFSVIQFSVFSKKSQGDCREEAQKEKVSSGSVFSFQQDMAKADP